MGLDSYRKNATPALEKISALFMKFNPNTLTIVSFILALISGVTIGISGRYIPTLYLLVAFISLVLSSLLDAMDGFVARKKGIGSPAGDMLDHTFDRYSDMALLSGFAFSVFGNVYIGILALGAVFMTSYMGTQAQAIGLRRNYGGVLGRADRLVIMMIIILVQLIFPFSYKIYVEITPVNIMLIWFLLAGHITAAKRFKDSLTGLKNEQIKK
jgi:archaetidylinositol phosphate synthase